MQPHDWKCILKSQQHIYHLKLYWALIDNHLRPEYLMGVASIFSIVATILIYSSSSLLFSSLLILLHYSLLTLSCTLSQISWGEESSSSRSCGLPSFPGSLYAAAESIIDAAPISDLGPSAASSPPPSVSTSISLDCFIVLPTSAVSLEGL